MWYHNFVDVNCCLLLEMARQRQIATHSDTAPRTNHIMAQVLSTEDFTFIFFNLGSFFSRFGFRTKVLLTTLPPGSRNSIVVVRAPGACSAAESGEFDAQRCTRKWFIVAQRIRKHARDGSLADLERFHSYHTGSAQTSARPPARTGRNQVLWARRLAGASG